MKHLVIESIYDIDSVEDVLMMEMTLTFV